MDLAGFTGGLSREPRLPLTGAEQQILAQAMAALRLTTVA